MKLPKALTLQFLFFLLFFISVFAPSPLGAVSYNPADFQALIPPQTVTVQSQQGVAVFDAQHYHLCPGQPKLPKQVARILLPEDADLATLTYTLKNVKEDDLGTGWEVEPAPPYQCRDESVVVPKMVKLVDGKDVYVYNNNAFFPSSWTGSIKSGNMRRFKVAHVEIYPYRYNPVTKTLKRISSATLAVSVAPDPNYVPLKNPKSFSSAEVTSLFFLKTHVANMSAFSTSAAFDGYYPSYNSSPLLGSILQAPKLPPLMELQGFPPRTYVIITTNHIAYDSNPPSQQLEPFVLSKESRFFDVTLVTEDKTFEVVNGNLQQTGNQGWGGNFGVLGAEDIRDYLTADVEGLPRWDAWDIEHVLLIGCPDPDDGGVPMKKTFPFIEALTPDHPRYELELMTDLYYSELTEDWTSPASGYAAPLTGHFSVSIDLMPEVAVARIPVTGYGMNVAELDDILEKIIAYTDEPASKIGWRRNVLLPAKPIAYLYPSWNHAEKIKDICQQNGFSYYRIYDSLCGYNIDFEFEEKLDEAIDAGVVAPHKREDYMNAFGAMKLMCVEIPWFSNPDNWQSLVDFFDELNLNYNHGFLAGVPVDDDPYNDDGTRAAYNEDVVRAAWLSQNFGVVSWYSHGYHKGAAYIIDLDNHNLYPPMDDQHPAFVLMNSCLNGNPYEHIHFGYNIAFDLLHQGAIGTISASTISYSLPDHFDATWLGYMIEGQLELGTARLFTVAHQYAVGNDYELLVFNPYGDSTVGLYTCVTK